MPERSNAVPRHRRLRWACVLGACSLGTCLLAAPLGCQKTYYTVLESVGIEKRELLAKRVEKAKDSQEEAQEEFRDALERFQAVTGHEGGDLEDKYERLRDAYESSREQAAEVKERIDKIESVADALFDEWEGELKQYSDPSLRQGSAERLSSTRTQVRALLRVMRKAERSLKPVLEKLNDRVLYLKHNLNAAALSGLRAKLPELQDDVARLVREMQTSIAEADQFIESMK